MLVNLFPDGVLDFTEHEIQEVCVFGLEHENVVGGVDQAVAGNLLVELVGHIALEPIEEVSHHFVMFAFHLHLVELGDENGVVVPSLAGVKGRIRERLQKREGAADLRNSHGGA